MFFGSIPALVTPFSGGRVAEDTFCEFVDWQIAEGSNGLVPCGTTGESATLVPRRASPGDRTRRAGREWPSPGDRRLRQLFDGRCDRSGAGRGRRRRRRGAGRRSILQQAEPGRASRRISPRLPKPRRSRSSSTMCRRGPSPTFRSRRWPKSRSIRGSSPSRMRLETSPAFRRSGSLAARNSSSCRAMTTWRSASTPWAGSAAFRSPPTSRRGSAPNSRRRCAKAVGTKRSGSRTGFTRCTPLCSPMPRRRPTKYALYPRSTWLPGRTPAAPR